MSEIQNNTTDILNPVELAKQKRKALFDFYQNIKNDIEVLSIEDLEIAIKTIELAKEEMKIREQQRIRATELDVLEKKEQKDVPGVVYLRDNLKRLPERAFEGRKDITKLEINKGLTEIGEYAFAGCENLREIVFPDNRIILRRGCFKDCTSIKEVDIPDVANICPEAFENCISLKKVVFPWTISNIYSRAFKNCRSLEQVSFKKRISYYISIFPNVFENCISLKTIELPKNTWFDSKSFTNCSNLKTIYTHRAYHKKLEKCDAQYVEI